MEINKFLNVLKIKKIVGRNFLIQRIYNYNIHRINKSNCRTEI